MIWFSLALSTEKTWPPMTAILLFYSVDWYKAWRKAAQRIVPCLILRDERIISTISHVSAFIKKSNISVVNLFSVQLKENLRPLTLCDWCLFRFGLLPLCTLPSDRSITYALNLVALHRDVLQSALLQSQGCLCWLINWGNAWSDLFTKHT